MLVTCEMHLKGNEMRVRYWEKRISVLPIVLSPASLSADNSLELRLLQPFPHPAEGFPARLELAPGLRVPEQVWKRPLRAAQHPLGEDSLRDGWIFSVPWWSLWATSLVLTSSICPELLPLLSCDPGPEERFCSLVEPRTWPWPCALRWACGLMVVYAVNRHHARRRRAHVLLPVSSQHRGVVCLDPLGVSIFSVGMVAPGVRVGRQPLLGIVNAA